MEAQARETWPARVPVLSQQQCRADAALLEHQPRAEQEARALPVQQRSGAEFELSPDLRSPDAVRPRERRQQARRAAASAI